MTFYMKPPRGNIALHTLHKCVQQRFEFLLSLENGDVFVPQNFEYLYDGTPMDRVGHFLLRLVSLSSHNFKNFVMKAETRLFVNRLSMLNYKEIINMLKILYKHVKELLQLLPNMSLEFSEFLSGIKDICKYMIKLDKAAHTFKEDHREDCSCYSINVPFRMCLPLVQKREVELKSGKCIIPCGKWKILLHILFRLHLEFGMKHTQETGCLQQALHDSRIQHLAKVMQRRFGYDTVRVSGSRMAAKDVAAQSVYFPPCMAHLYQTLRSRHRLTHEARRQFTLFLKDAGMPVEEALVFWSTEYSQPTSECRSGCTHSWQKDAHRYRYSIRHMYGLEGGRYQYKVSNCCKIQGTQLTPQAEGGCPFHHFDDARLISCFSSQLLEDETTLNTIINLKASGRSHDACCLHFTAQRNIIRGKSSDVHYNVNTSDKLSHNESSSIVSFVNPVQYYLHLKEEKNVAKQNQ